MGKTYHKYTLLQGGTVRTVINGLTIEVVHDSIFPLPVDVRVFEEDTHLVLTVDPIMRYKDEHPIRLMTEILEARPRHPGSVVTRGSSWYAVVHDVDAEPISRDVWIAEAYRQSLKLAEEMAVARLGVPLLGSVHGTFPFQDSVQLLLEQIRAQKFFRLKVLVILAAMHEMEDIKRMVGEEHI